MPKHPYESLEGTSLWKTLNDAIDALVENRDLTETTARTHIVGYIAKALVENGVAVVNREDA